MASFYGAEYWYPELYAQGLTPESRLIPLSEDDVQHILVHGTFSSDVETAIQAGLDAGFHFIKSSKKSSNMCRAVYNMGEATAEICDYADVLITFKYGCRYLFMRRYVDIDTEYRVVVHHGQVRYVELHTLRTDTTPIADVEHRIQQCIAGVISAMHYRDATVDIALLRDGSWTCIEINTPIYMFAGLTFNKDVASILEMQCKA
jgi:hypothetical protein